MGVRDTHLIRAYLRASTKTQDANRAKRTLKEFVDGFDMKIATYYVENESGVKINRPELMRLVEESCPGDILLVESMDRLTRLIATDWEKLKRLFLDSKIRIVVVDLPSTHIHMTGTFDGRITELLNNFFLDLYAEFAHRDWERRKKVTRDGIEKAKRDGKFTGRVANADKHRLLIRLFAEGKSISEIINATGYTERHCYNLKSKYLNQIDQLKKITEDELND